MTESASCGLDLRMEEFLFPNFGLGPHVSEGGGACALLALRRLYLDGQLLELSSRLKALAPMRPTL